MENTIEKDASNYNNILQTYMRDVNKYKLFNELEERTLTQEYIETQSPKLREKLIKHNLRLVVKIAFEYRAAYGNLMDLIQEGNFGLIRGVEKYDPSRGVPLAHYASNWIRAFMLRYIINNSRLVKLGTTEAQRKLFFNLAKEKAKLEAQGIEVTDSLLAEKLKVDEKELVEMEKRLASPDASIDIDNSNEDSTNLHKIFDLRDNSSGPDEALEQAELRNSLQTQLHKFRQRLSTKNAMVFDRRLVAEEPDTFEVIGVDLRVTRQRVQQIEVELKSKLASFLRNQLHA